MNTALFQLIAICIVVAMFLYLLAIVHEGWTEHRHDPPLEDGGNVRPFTRGADGRRHYVTGIDEVTRRRRG